MANFTYREHWTSYKSNSPPLYNIADVRGIKVKGPKMDMQDWMDEFGCCFAPYDTTLDEMSDVEREDFDEEIYCLLHGMDSPWVITGIGVCDDGTCVMELSRPPFQDLCDYYDEYSDDDHDITPDIMQAWRVRTMKVAVFDQSKRAFPEDVELSLVVKTLNQSGRRYKKHSSTKLSRSPAGNISITENRKKSDRLIQFIEKTPIDDERDDIVVQIDETTW